MEPESRALIYLSCQCTTYSNTTTIMKHKILFSLLLLLLPFCLSSCGGDEDESNPLVGHAFRCQMGSEYSQYTFFDGYLGTVCDFVLVSPGGNMQNNSISYSWYDKTKEVKVPSTGFSGRYDRRSKSIIGDAAGEVYKLVEESNSGKIDTPDRAKSIARELWSLMIHVTDAIETGYQYTNYEFSYGGGTVKITGLKYDDSQNWTITSLSECILTNVSGFTGSLAYEDQNTHSARSSSSGTYYKRQMSLQTIGSGYPMKYKDDKLEGSFSTSLYKDNSSSLLRPNDKFGSMYADTDPVSGTLKNDAGSAFSIFFN